MALDLPPLRGEPVSDEVQLDGSRHLTVQAGDAGQQWLVTLHLIVDREHDLREGELTLEGPDAAWSGALEDVLDFEARGSLRLRALFCDPDAGEEQVVVELEEDAGGSYHLLVVFD